MAGDNGQAEFTVYGTITSDNYKAEIDASGHRLIADEPTDLGGTDTGPDPYALLLSSLAACTLMTLVMYSQRKEWPLESAEVELSHERIHAADCADCESKEGKVSRIRRQLTFHGDLDANQRARLLEIADRCPVHRTLTGEIRIESSLRD